MNTGILIYHLRQPFGRNKNIVNYFAKSLSQEASASAVVTPERPARMDYDARKGRIVHSFYNEVRNRYGNIPAQSFIVFVSGVALS